MMNLNFFKTFDTFLQNYKSKKDNSVKSAQMNKVISDYTSAMYDMSLFNPYNPSKLVLAKTLNIYDEMYQYDEHIKALLNLKKNFIIGGGWTIDSDNLEDEDQQMMVDFCWDMLDKDFKGIFNKKLKDILSSFQFGFSVSELIYKISDNKKWAGKVVLDTLLTRPPHSFEFCLDEKGNIKELKQNSYNNNGALPIDKFLIYTNDMQFGNPYGLSDFHCIYGYYVLKKMIKRYTGIAAEKFAMPVVVGKVPPNTTPEQLAEFLDLLKKMQANSAFAIKENSSLEFLESKNKGGLESYQKLLEMINTFFTRSFLVPELMGFSQHDTGSQALGREHYELTKQILIIPEQQSLEDLINERILLPILKMNFGEKEMYPFFKFKTSDKKDNEFLKLWIDAVQKRVVKSTIDDENFIRGKLGFSQREESELDIEPKKEPKTADKSKLEFKDKANFENRTNTGEIDKLFKNQGQSFALNLNNITEDIKTSIEKEIKDKKIIEKKNFNYVNKLNIDSFLPKLKKIFKTFTNDTYTESKQLTKDDMIENSKNKINFAEQQYTFGAFEPEQTIKYLNTKPVFLTNNESEFIVKGMKNILNDGLKTGKTESEIINNLEIFFRQYDVGQLDSSGNIKNINDISGRSQTIIRTNLSEAFNMGRMDIYNSKAGKEIIAAFQYSAIMDDNTTDFCASMDGKIFAATDPIWDTITPPNHFNCRSLLIPVFKWDEYDINKIPNVNPAKGFGG